MIELALLLTLSGGCERQPLSELLETEPRLAQILAAPRNYRVQVIVREIGPCKNRRTYREDAEYFYPASAIKLVAAAAAVHWAEENGVGLDESLIVGEAPPMTLRENLDRTLVVSSNPGFNWLYDVAGVERMHSLLWAAGYSSFRMRHRFGARAYPRSAQATVPAVLAVDRQTLAPERTMTKALPKNVADDTLIGIAHVDPQSRERLPRPMPFAERNAITLGDLQGVLIDIVHPGLDGSTLPLSAKGRAALRAQLERIVDEPPKPGAPPDRIRYKPLLAGVRRGVPQPERVHVESKAGRAYGFLVDNAYYRYRGRELFIAAAIYVNANGVIGDDTYEYESVGLRFFEALGELLAREVFSPR
ncbi:MAG: serine hydrolase [Myxococcota bacterium]